MQRVFRKRDRDRGLDGVLVARLLLVVWLECSLVLVVCFGWNAHARGVVGVFVLAVWLSCSWVGCRVRSLVGMIVIVAWSECSWSRFG